MERAAVMRWGTEWMVAVTAKRRKMDPGDDVVPFWGSQVNRKSGAAGLGRW